MAIKKNLIKIVSKIDVKLKDHTFLRAKQAIFNGDFFKKVTHKTFSQFVKETPIDLRKQYTFRTPVEGKDISILKIGQVRDLHQLLLTGIGHTDRHITQIRNIKKHPEWPN